MANGGGYLLDQERDQERAYEEERDQERAREKERGQERAHEEERRRRYIFCWLEDIKLCCVT